MIIGNIVICLRSKPLPTDTYWKASKRAGWEVITHERNPYNGREKKVDGTIIAQATLCAALEKDPIIAILSGDGDYAPVIQAVSTLNKNISIEIWSWDRSLSRCYRQYEKDYSFVKTYSLDEHFNEITFIAQEFKSPVANIPRERTLVAVGLDGHPQMKEFMRNYPRVQYTNFGNDKVIIFPENQVSGKFDDFFTEAKSFFSDAQDNIISYVEYSNRTNAPSSSTLSVSNPFEALDELDDDETEQLEEKIAEDVEETKWETINRPKRLIEEKKNKKCQRCWKGLFCRKFATRGCEYTHPPTIVEFQRKGAKMRKYQLCKQGNNCKFAAVPWKCEFLHPGEVRLCLWCNKQHNTSICF